MTDFTTGALKQTHPHAHDMPMLFIAVAHAGIIGGDIYISVAIKDANLGNVVIRSSGGKFDLANPNSSYHQARALHTAIQNYDQPSLPADLALTPPPRNKNIYLSSDNLDDTSTGEPVALNIIADEETQTFYLRTQKYGPVPKFIKEHAPQLVQNRKSPWVPIHQATTPEAYAALDKIYAEISTEQAQKSIRKDMVQAVNIGGLAHDYAPELIDKFRNRFAEGSEFSLF